MTAIEQHLEWLRERQAFLENTECISEALEVEYIIYILCKTNYQDMAHIVPILDKVKQYNETKNIQRDTAPD